MKRIEITINGVAYPCSPTMGAMLRFKEQTGKEINNLDPNSFSELCVFLYCCVVSASKREGKQFNLSLMDFADAVAPEQMEEWNKSLASQGPDKDDADEKKSK